MAILYSSRTGTDRLADQSGTITKGSEIFDNEVHVVSIFLVANYRSAL